MTHFQASVETHHNGIRPYIPIGTYEDVSGNNGKVSHLRLARAADGLVTAVTSADARKLAEVAASGSKYTVGVIVDVDRRNVGHRPAHTPNYPPYPTTKNMGGYEVIGEPVTIGYDSPHVDVDVPQGETRGLVFEPLDTQKQFRLTFFKIGKGLHGTYQSVGVEGVLNNLIAGRTYAIPDGMDKLKAPLPKIYDAHGRRIL